MAFDGESSINNVVGIMQAKYGMSPGAAANLFAQLNHESAWGTSRLAQENHNFGGLTQSEPNGEDNKQPDGGNYYRMFNSDEEYADAMYNDFFRYYPEIMNASDPYQYAHILKQNGYYGDDESNYASSIADIAKQYNPSAVRTSWSPVSGNGQPMFTANMKLNMNDPNEKMDVAGLMSILQGIPRQNVAAAGDRALRDQLLLQAQHLALGKFQAPYFKDSDNSLMKSAIAKAEEDAKLANSRETLTGAGKVAKMIAESKNSSNAKAYAELASMAGIKVDPMADRYVDQNKLVLNNIAQQQEQYKENQKYAQQKALADQQFNQKKALMDYQNQLDIQKAGALSQMGLGSSRQSSSAGSNGGGQKGLSASAVISQQKYINDTYDTFSKQMQELVDSFDVNGINDDSGNQVVTLLGKAARQLQDLPDSTMKLQILREMQNDAQYVQDSLAKQRPGIQFIDQYAPPS